MFAESPAFTGTERGVETSLFEELPVASTGHLFTSQSASKEHKSKDARVSVDIELLSDEEDFLPAKKRRKGNFLDIYQMKLFTLGTSTNDGLKRLQETVLTRELAVLDKKENFYDRALLVLDKVEKTIDKCNIQ